MIPTISWTKENFDKLNALYFSNSLPRPEFLLKKAKSFYGCFYSYRTKEMAARHHKPYGELAMSVMYDRTELDLLGTLLHEMIHLWQFWNDKSRGHGFDFKAKAAEFNRHGWNIQRVGGHPDSCALAAYNSVAVPEYIKVQDNSRKIAALRRSISVLRSRVNPTTADIEKLKARRAELSKLIG